jgi:hypothetical protein
MDMITINNDGTFDTGAAPVSTSATWQELGRLRAWGRHVLASLIIGPQTIGGFRIRQCAYPDDPNPLAVGTSTDLNSPSLANESYVLPAMTFPLAAGSTYEIHLQGDAVEYIFEAETAGAAGATAQVKGWVKQKE